KTGRRQDDYLELIARFPLRSIRTDEDLDAAVEVVNALIDRDSLSAGARDYLDALSDLIESYESRVHPMKPVSDAEMLTHLIEAKGVSQADVTRATGIAESTISEILAGKR